MSINRTGLNSEQLGTSSLTKLSDLLPSADKNYLLELHGIQLEDAEEIHTKKDTNISYLFLNRYKR